MNDKIDIEVDKIHKEIWQNREKFWPDVTPSPIEMLDPHILAEILKVQYEEVPEIQGSQFNKSTIAGLLDRQSNKIVVSQKYAFDTIRFTAMHEFGHFIFHEDEIMHRDRPIVGLNKIKRSPLEREADKFSARILMPKNLVISAFEKRFGKGRFKFNDTTAFYLNPSNPNELLRSNLNSLDRALALATFENKYISLAKQFKVSATSMAIRIEELNLVEWP